MYLLNLEYKNLIEQLDSETPGSELYLIAFEKLEKLAERGCKEACSTIAELRAFEPAVYNPEEAYKWYYIALKKEGYSVDFQNLSGSSDTYLGPVGDFRNEAQVSDLVDALGLDKINFLDQKAKEWLTKYS